MCAEQNRLASLLVSSSRVLSGSEKNLLGKDNLSEASQVLVLPIHHDIFLSCVSSLVVGLYELKGVSNLNESIIC